MTSARPKIDFDAKIPNNVDLASDRKLQRALERWQPNFLDWWGDMGPAVDTKDVYLRTAVDVGREGWAHFDHVPMNEYRWGVFLSEHDPDRKIAFGEHKGEPVWQEVPGEYRADLQRLIVIQGDTEPASVEQQRFLGATAPSLYDMRNLFQVNVEEGRHLWAMVYLLHAYFGRAGREEADQLLRAQLRLGRLAAHPRGLQRGDPGLAVVLHVHLLHRPGRQVPARHAEGVGLRPAPPHLRVHAQGGGPPHVRGHHRHRPRRDPHRAADERARLRGGRRAPAASRWT